MPARIQEQLVAFGKKQQTDISTASLVADIWRLRKLNTEIVNPNLVTENDAEEMGKGHEFATEVFKSHWDVGLPYRTYVSSEIMAWLGAAGLGSSVKTDVGPFDYTAVPADPVATGLERPYFTVVNQIRTGGAALIDQAWVGMAVNDFALQMRSGPGRESSVVEFNLAGTGQLDEPSTIVIPARTVENLLPAASAAITIIGTDYVTLKRIIELDWGFTNDFQLEDGFFPGSGVQDGAAIRGRIEHGTRAATLRFVARMESSSDELTKLRALTSGTAIITQTFDAAETYTVTFHDVTFGVVEVGEQNGIVRVEVQCVPKFHTTNGLLTLVSRTAVDEVGE